MKRIFKKEPQFHPSNIATRIVKLSEEIQQIKFELRNLRDLERAYESENKKRVLELIEELAKEYHRELAEYSKELGWENVKLSRLANQDKKVNGIDWKERIQLIKLSVPIERVISDHVKLKKSDDKLCGVCPFCDALEPSFIVDPVKSLFTCSSCLKNGDVFTFMMKIETLDFKDSVKVLYSRYVQ